MSKPWLIAGVAEGCPFNGYIDCSGASASCSTCGWNPDVRKARVREWQAANEGKDFSVAIAKIRRLNKR